MASLAVRVKRTQRRPAPSLSSHEQLSEFLVLGRGQRPPFPGRRNSFVSRLHRKGVRVLQQSELARTTESCARPHAGGHHAFDRRSRSAMLVWMSWSERGTVLPLAGDCIRLEYWDLRAFCLTSPLRSRQPTYPSADELAKRHTHLTLPTDDSTCPAIYVSVCPCYAVGPWLPLSLIGRVVSSLW